jgi:hypothetical protein
MSLVSIQNTIESRFNTLWGATTPVAYPNVTFVKPSSGEWAALQVKFGSQNQASLNAGTQRFYRQKGIVTVQIFTSLNRGAKRAMTLADQTAAIWRGIQVNGITFYAPETVVIGNVEGVYQVNVSTSFYVDELL